MTGHHAERRYFRVLPLADFGIARDFEVVWVQFAIGEAPGSPARRPVAVRLHTLAGERILANLTQIADKLLELPEPAPSPVEVSFANAVVPVGHALVIEVLLAGDQDDRNGQDDLASRIGAGDARRRGFQDTDAGLTGPVRIDTASDAQLRMTIHGRER